MNRATARSAMLGAATVALAGLAAHSETPEIVVRQAHRAFIPQQATIPRGTAVRFVNEEALTHHAFVDTPAFAVDSGDIPPGGAATLVFDRAGRFTVRCAIHPQMSLAVEVTP